MEWLVMISQPRSTSIGMDVIYHDDLMQARIQKLLMLGPIGNCTTFHLNDKSDPYRCNTKEEVGGGGVRMVATLWQLILALTLPHFAPVLSPLPQSALRLQSLSLSLGGYRPLGSCFLEEI